MKVCFITFGCRLNKAEALQMEAEYLARGWELTDKHSEADLFVVRGCSVTAHAQHECEKLIAHLQRRHPSTPVHICGCITNEEAASSPLEKKESPPSVRSGEDAASPLPMRTARAFLKVQDGCSGKCTFCIVPKFRGPSRSVPFTELLDKAKRFIDAGYREIVVTGCNLSLYASEDKRLPELLAGLAELASSVKSGQESASPLCRFRIGSLEPGSCALETVRVMAEHANICRFLHIPVQAGSDRILTAMGRPYRVQDVDTLVAAAVDHLPNLGLGCDLMTGFPGETEADFNATKDLLERLPFNNAHVFPYSERPGTPAAAFGESVPKNIRSERATRLSRIAGRYRQDFARTFVGKTVEIIVEDREKTVGWTDEYLKCTADGSAPRKSSVRIRVTAIRNDVLSGLVLT